MNLQGEYLLSLSSSPSPIPPPVQVSVPLHTVFRSSSLPASLVIGYFFFKHKYTAVEVLSCLCVTIGTIVITLADAQAKLADSTGAAAAIAAAAATAAAAASAGAVTATALVNGGANATLAVTAATAAATSLSVCHGCQSAPVTDIVTDIVTDAAVAEGGVTALSILLYITSTIAAGATCMLQPLHDLSATALQSFTTFVGATFLPHVSSAAEVDAIVQWMLGIFLLFVSLMLSGLLGHLQQSYFSKYGAAPDESKFFCHFLTLPGFIFVAQNIMQHFRFWFRAPDFAISKTLPVPALLIANADVVCGLAALTAFGVFIARYGRSVTGVTAVVASVTLCLLNADGDSTKWISLVSSPSSLADVGQWLLQVLVLAASCASTLLRVLGVSVTADLTSAVTSTVTSAVTTPAVTSADLTPVLISFRMSALWAIALNLLSQLVCVTGVYQMTSSSSSLTTTLAITVRKFVSLILSIVYFGHHFGGLHWTGAVLVFLGALTYVTSYLFADPKPAGSVPSKDSASSPTTGSPAATAPSSSQQLGKADAVTAIVAMSAPASNDAAAAAAAAAALSSSRPTPKELVKIPQVSPPSGASPPRRRRMAT